MRFWGWTESRAGLIERVFVYTARNFDRQGRRALRARHAASLSVSIRVQFPQQYGRDQTMIAAESLPRMTVSEYLAFEQESEIRHELVDGYLYAMTGASDRHEEIAANLLAALHGHLQGTGCRVYGSNLKIRVGDDFFYPDLFVRCSKRRGDSYFKTDPMLVIEILSPNTQRYDRGDKRLAYQSLPSLQEYVLVAQDEPRIEILRRTEVGWHASLHQGVDALLELRCIELNLRLARVYA
jgi:Uma2 family endonuclease